MLKHFPGYGNNTDTHTGIAVDRRPVETFETSDFLPFEAGIQAGGGMTAVLVSHNIMTCVDDTLPASLSPAVHGLLRDALGFDGVVMTDDLAMDAVAAYAQDGAAAVMALEAGNDLVLTTGLPAPRSPKSWRPWRAVLWRSLSLTAPVSGCCGGSPPWGCWTR